MERPILFSTEMVQAVLSGRKTQTRRVLKAKTLRDLELGHQLGECFELDDPRSTDCAYIQSFCPYGQIGDQLWVRETWRKYDCDECPCYEYCNCPPHGTYLYYADSLDDESKWKPSIHMPRSASRILLEITNIRIERLNDISDADAIAEGVEPVIVPDNVPVGIGWEKEDRHMWKGYKNNDRAYQDTAIDSFNSLWESIKGDGSWNENPWVWIVEFKKVAALRGIKG